MRYKGLIILGMVIILSGCSEYQQVLKSKDPELKYTKALDYFNDGQYVRSQALLEDVMNYFKGTERAQEVLTYLARSYMGQKTYNSAAEYYQAYLRNYPKGRYSTEAHFQVGHCYYLDAPDARLDQDITRKAIASFQTFIELYPESPYIEQAYQEMGEMYDQLAYKELLNAQLYYNLGTYLGNNYLSAEITAKNALKLYPSNKYKEDFDWVITQALYQQMIYSEEGKKEDRARDAEDECYNFTVAYPNSKHVNQANRMMKEIKKVLSTIDK